MSETTLKTMVNKVDKPKPPSQEVVYVFGNDARGFKDSTKNGGPYSPEDKG